MASTAGTPSPFPRRFVLAMLAAASLTGCRLEPEWRVHASGEGGYQAEFPRPVHRSVETGKSKLGDHPLHFATAQYGAATFSVLWMDYPQSYLKKFDAEAILDAAARGAAGNMTAGRLLHAEALKHQERWPAQRILVRHGGDLWLEGRIVLAGRRLYQVTVSYRDGDPDASEAIRDRFLTSFRVTR